MSNVLVARLPHQEPKLLTPFVADTVQRMLEERVLLPSSSSSEVEVDVAEWFQVVTEEAITRATFGRSYDDGQVVFAMQGRLMAYASEAFRKVLVPGYRCVSSPSRIFLTKTGSG